MELKPTTQEYRCHGENAFNRTSMELKRAMVSEPALEACAFNRTSMELKLIPIGRLVMVGLGF